jgi:hypothetical protein
MWRPGEGEAEERPGGRSARSLYSRFAEVAYNSASGFGVPAGGTDTGEGNDGSGTGPWRLEPIASVGVTAIEGGGMPKFQPQPVLTSTDDVGRLEFLERENAQLREALSSRIVIEQAKGVLAERFALDVDEAFELLRRAARSHRMPMHVLAAAVTTAKTTPAEIEVAGLRVASSNGSAGEQDRVEETS